MIEGEGGDAIIGDVEIFDVWKVGYETVGFCVLLLRAEGEKFEGFKIGECADGGKAVFVHVEACNIREDVEPVES